MTTSTTQAMLTPARELTAVLRLYTVVGLTHDEGLVVAGVIAGEHFCCDSNAGNDQDGYRYCTVVHAIDPDDAEQRAVAEYAELDGR